MNALTIKDPADLLSFIGHTLGFWPTESLVCITLDKGKVGATLRIDLPRQAGTEVLYARTVSSYLTSDTNATSIVFALYTSTPCEPGQPKPHAATIAALTGVLAENGISIRDGIFVSNDAYSPYDSDLGQDISLPLTTTEYSRVNAEFIYRGSTIEPTNRIILPTPTQDADHATAVKNGINTIRAQAPQEAALQASRLWTAMLDSNDFPTDEDCALLIASFQFPHIRDRLMADIPGIDEPPQHILFAQTETAPKWSRIEWAQQLLLHAYTRTSSQHAAPILTTIGYINWWEGRGSKAHQYMQLALETDPGYRFARLTDQMLGAGMIAAWNTNKDTAYKTRLDMP
ncbi:DUF4192 domain-containing protein [Paenarthrobacter nitroguajacolicus]|uniref:DUF4192 domain-containing protein n=1 Tax=Paenarthrobacter nitroguajacolicus TaxID=211146 RepID=UPI0015BE71FB|nr:DUF4192 domain-containing protein [Paenarthrobacter nitroguajacolicus]NWL12171.1 DUF4192 domain-containing protein [Paenarthrobacter nitroguajacolicus]